MLLRCIFGAPHYHREKWVRNIGHDHADSLRFLLDKAARNQVRPVIQLANRFLDPLTPRFADVSFVIDDRGDSENRDVGLSRDVRNACRFFSLPGFRSSSCHSFWRAPYQNHCRIQNV